MTDTLHDIITARAKRREGAREFGPDYLRRRYDEDAAFEAVVLAGVCPKCGCQERAVYSDLPRRRPGENDCTWGYHDLRDHLRDVIGGRE